MGAFYTKFSIINPEFLIFPVNLAKADFLSARFQIVVL